MQKEKRAPRKHAKCTTSIILGERPESRGTSLSTTSAGRLSGKVSRFPNKGTCPRCGKTIERNPDVVAYCDCYAYCQKCGEPLILLHRLKEKTVAMLHETFGFPNDAVGLCPVCANVEYPITKGVSTMLPQEVKLN